MNSYEEIAKTVRSYILEAHAEAQSGHPTSSFSSTDIGTVLFSKFFRCDVSNPDYINNDRFILSKGHASSLLYTLFALSNGFPVEKLKTLRKFGSELQGHPTPDFPFAQVTTGSLGQGLSIGNGFALGAKRSDLSFKTYVLMGDGEMAEGSVWEACNFASYYKLDNLVAIVDVNRLGQSQQTMFGHSVDEYEKRLFSFGWDTRVIDGHNYSEIEAAFNEAAFNTKGKPYAIIAKTIKGKGVSFLEDKDGWHGKVPSREEIEEALQELGEVDKTIRFSLQKPEVAQQQKSPGSEPLRIDYKKGDEIATREAYGNALSELGNSDPDIYALDGDTKNSTFSELFLKAHPDRFVECFIAEQNMVGVSLGLSKLGKKTFTSTFAAFFTRAFDQIRMANISRGNMVFVGSHAGVSIGEDGPSQMGLEDFAMFGSLPGSIIFHPSDAVSTAKITEILLQQTGISYMRTLRPKTPVIYESSESFEVGGSKTLKSSDSDEVIVVAAGITVFEALEAYKALQAENINVTVIDCYCIKPVDKKALEEGLKKVKQRKVIVVEDHFTHGGLGDFVLEALAESDAQVYKMTVDHVSRSGTKEELLKDAGISSSDIIAKVKEII